MAADFHNDSIKLIVTLKPTLDVDNKNSFYNQAVSENILIQSMSGTEIVQNNHVYIDFFNPRTMTFMFYALSNLSV